ncbi:alpha-L-fucosidase [Persicirhabdus sediminis]|uniref:alpha-L-fucosidase n=1 Tax=Persicirhabdus sediminis TaxID=454144 RepID=A0A8J7SKU0_9BACT|nr:alpha-L-fucosidase [Persicirhabdus sediminis]MBK1790990.1 alpha-L-fucosidase [Persicirhabdus sediminis]
MKRNSVESLGFVALRAPSKFVRSCVLGLSIISGALMGQSASAEERFTADWESLKGRDHVPDWLQDAKFGIWFCWGPASYYYEGVPMRTGNPIGGMYNKENALYDYNTKRFGADPCELGWHGVIKKWQPNNFDPKAWVDLFVESGAKYGSIMADHEDGFVLWDSEVNPWNPVNYGPKVDIVGELAKEYRSRGMKIFIYANGGRVWKYVPAAWQNGVDTAKYPELYLEDHSPTAEPSSTFSKYYYNQMSEMIEKYEPDALWFDVFFKAVLPDEDRRKIIAKYYNTVDKAGKLEESVFFHKHGDLIPTGAHGHERGIPGHMQSHFFGTGNSLGMTTWYPRRLDLEGNGYQDETLIIPTLVDIVCKNGFLNLATIPDANGGIPEVQVKILKAIGVWLKQNGKAIYATRPWVVAGEGPFMESNGAKKIDSRKDHDYTKEELRFTRSKDGKTIYVFAYTWEAGEVMVKSIGCKGDGVVSLLGHGEVTHSVNDLGQLTITVPSGLDEQSFRRDLPIAFELSGFETSLLEGVSGASKVIGPKPSTMQSILWRVVTDASVNGAVPAGKDYLSARARKTLGQVYDNWMENNRAAISESKPWLVYGEGPNLDNKGRSYYTGEDLRFTQAADESSYYVIAMSRPEEKTFKVTSLWCQEPDGKPQVTLLGHGPVEHHLNDKMQLEITLPDELDEINIRPDLPMSFELKGYKVQKHYDLD